ENRYVLLVDHEMRELVHQHELRVPDDEFLGRAAETPLVRARPGCLRRIRQIGRRTRAFLTRRERRRARERQRDAEHGCAASDTVRFGHGRILTRPPCAVARPPRAPVVARTILNPLRPPIRRPPQRAGPVGNRSERSVEEEPPMPSAFAEFAAALSRIRAVARSPLAMWPPLAAAAFL